jgi:hypothetical protein
MAFFTDVVEIMGAFRPKYEPLNGQQDDEPKQHDSQIPNSHRDRRTLRLKIIALGFCLGILVATFLILVVIGLILNSFVTHICPTAESHWTPTTDAAVNPSFSLRKTGTSTCGRDADEARALGCIWDIVGFFYPLAPDFYICVLNWCNIF